MITDNEDLNTSQMSFLAQTSMLDQVLTIEGNIFRWQIFERDESFIAKGI
jgi:hypothetical protein